MQLPCQTNPDAWFGDDPDDIERAKAGCLECPASRRIPCREQGWNHEYGVWGGLSPLDRQRESPARYRRLVESAEREAARSDRVLKITRALRLLSEGHTGQRVADMLGVPQSTVRTWAVRYRLSASGVVTAGS